MQTARGGGAGECTPSNLDRSAFVRLASAAAGTAPFGSAPRPDYGPLIVQLPWIKNVNWAGEYFADRRGYYREAGFTSDMLLASGPGAAPVEELVASGHAFVAISSIATTAAAIMQGADLKTIGVQYQTSPYIAPRDRCGRKNDPKRASAPRPKASRNSILTDIKP